MNTKTQLGTFWRVSTLLGLVLLATGTGVSVMAQSAPSDVPTFNKDVAPILFKTCATCHRPDQIAPMSLLSYKEARPWTRGIKAKIMSGSMPPWFADSRFGEFANDPRLTREEIRTIVAWVDGGAPEGNTPLAAQPPAAKGGWLHPSGRPPDLIVELGTPFAVPAGGEVPIFNTYEKIPEELKKQDRFVEAWQFMPGEPKGVHHASIGFTPLPKGAKLGMGPLWPGGPVGGNLIDIKTGAVFTGRGGDDETGAVAEEGATAKQQAAKQEAATARQRQGLSANFGPYVPGASFVQYPPGAGVRIPSDAEVLSWRFHYTPLGEAFADKSRVGFWFQKDLKVEIVGGGSSGERHRNNIVMGKELIEDASHPLGKGDAPQLPVIPAATANFAITTIKTFPQDVTMYSLMPHMHLRGKSITYVLVYPDGKERVLMSNPGYDFNWQLLYNFKEPIKIPAGTTMRAIAVYDNSSGNKYNPDPNKEVYWSEQSWDEMLSPFHDFSIDALVGKVRTSASVSQSSR